MTSYRDFQAIGRGDHFVLFSELPEGHGKTAQERPASHTYIRLFLTDYRTWASQDAPEPNRWQFKNNRALCSNLSHWCLSINLKEWERRDTSKEFEYILLYQFGTADYPFGGHMQHDRECRTRSLHRNPDRMAWINFMIENLSSI